MNGEHGNWPCLRCYEAGLSDGLGRLRQVSDRLRAAIEEDAEGWQFALNEMSVRQGDALGILICSAAGSMHGAGSGEKR